MAKLNLKLSATQNSIKVVAILFAIIVVVAVVAYSEVMFLAVISKAFPDGLLKPVAMVGGVATGVSVLTLLLAKAYWFRPGHQLTWSYIFTGIEVVILVLNVLLSFALANGPLKASDPMYTWYTLCPSSPIFALIGWTILIMLDRSQIDRHSRMEVEDEQREAELEHEREKHQAVMQLRSDMLKSEVHYFKEFMDSSEMQAAMKKAAQAGAMQEFSSFAGRYFAAMGIKPSDSGTPAMSDLNALFAQVDQQPTTGPLPAIGHRPTASGSSGFPDILQVPSDVAQAGSSSDAGGSADSNGKPKFTVGGS